MAPSRPDPLQTWQRAALALAVFAFHLACVRATPGAGR
jgi:hypothetical protein